MSIFISTLWEDFLLFECAFVMCFVWEKAWNFLQLLVLQWRWKDFLTGVFFVLSCIVYGVALLWEMDVACSASTPCIFDWWLLDLMRCNSLLRMIIGLWVGALMYSFLCWSLPAHFYFAFMQMYFDLVLSSQVHLCLFSCVRGLAPEHSFWVSLGTKNSSERVFLPFSPHSTAWSLHISTKSCRLSKSFIIFEICAERVSFACSSCNQHSVLCWTNQFFCSISPP